MILGTREASVKTLTPWITEKMPVAKKMKHNFVYGGHVNFFRLMRWCGLAPIQRDEQGMISFKLNLTSVYTVVLGVAMVTWSASLGLETASRLMKYDLPFEVVVMCGCMCTSPLIELLIFINLFDIRQLARLFNGWDTFQELLESRTNSNFRPKLFPSWPFWMALPGAGMATLTFIMMQKMFVLFNLKGIPSDGFHMLCLQAVPISFIVSGYMCLWIILTRAVCVAADATLAQLEKDVLGPQQYKKRLDEYRLLLLSLRTQCVGVGEAMGAKFLYISAFMFIVALPNIYFGAKTFATSSDFSVLLSALVSIIYISSTAEYSHQAVQKAGAQMENGITNILLSGKASQYEKELLDLLNTVQSAPVSISLLGFFNIDRGVNIPLYSSLITYIIIIMQYDANRGA